MGKKRTMFVHYGVEAVRATVHWRRKALAVTQVGKEELSITHVMTGNRMLVQTIKGMDLKTTIRAARVLETLFPWQRLSFHDIVTKHKVMGNKARAALKKAGVIP